MAWQNSHKERSYHRTRKRWKVRTRSKELSVSVCQPQNKASNVITGHASGFIHLLIRYGSWFFYFCKHEYSIIISSQGHHASLYIIFSWYTNILTPLSFKTHITLFSQNAALFMQMIWQGWSFGLWIHTSNRELWSARDSSCIKLQKSTSIYN